MSDRQDDVRAYIRAWVVCNHTTFGELAKKLDISERLLDEIVSGGYTHPEIARRVQSFFRLTDNQISQIISPNHVGDVIKHQRNLRMDDFTKKKYTEKEREYYNYKDQRFGRRKST